MRPLSSVLRRGPPRGLPFAFALALALPLLSPSRAADTYRGVEFLFPYEPDVTYHFLDVLNVSYISPFKRPLIYIYCDGDKTPIRTITDASPLNGSTLVSLDWSSTAACLFDLRPNEDPGHGRNSDRFFLLVEVKAQATIGQFGTSASTGATGTAATATTTSRPSLAGAPTTGAPPADGDAGPGGDDPSAAAGLQTGAKIGIGIGMFIAVIGGSAGIAAAVVVRRRRARCDAPCPYQVVAPPPPPSPPPRFSTIGSPARSETAHELDDPDKVATSEIDSVGLRPSGGTAGELGGGAGPGPHAPPSELP